uniref:Uncharacterized protein n=1 Tax=viral metagenome TaxID=1070528 RepID=A0A6C0ANF0_9ZZZZ
MSFMGRAAPEGLTNMGKPWSQEELNQLLQEIKEKKSIVDIATLHKRTQGGINSRLRETAAILHLNENKTIQECIEITGLDKSDIIDAISRREYNIIMKAKKVETKEKLKEQVLNKHVNITSERNIISKHVDPLHELRLEVNELKKDVKEILRLMNALYDFEASQ